MATASYLSSLGVYGFDAAEPVILAALVTEDPLLLVGRSGTGKTYLLNSLSEALGLEHRHYNASLISFDDLVGFPYPDAERASVRFLQTPATVWQAESVLIDEISRCKPEHQNRLFSLIHERRVQGEALTRLRFRWAAMNPADADDGAEAYVGSEPLDPALADRFSLFVTAGEWSQLEPSDQRAVADPAGEGKLSADAGRLKAALARWREEFLHRLPAVPPLVLDYASAVVSHLNAAAIRVSPRRARMLSRSLLAATVVTGNSSSALFRTVLAASLPHLAWGPAPGEEKVHAAHRAAWDEVQDRPDAWIHGFLAAETLADKLRLYLAGCHDPDQGSQAIAQLLASETKERAAAFAFAVYPRAAAGGLVLGAEGVNDLAKVAAPILRYEGELRWQESWNASATSHPEVGRLAKALAPLEGARAERARQFLQWCLLNKLVPKDMAKLERDLDACVELLRPS